MLAGIPTPSYAFPQRAIFISFAFCFAVAETSL